MSTRLVDLISPLTLEDLVDRLNSRAVFHIQGCSEGAFAGVISSSDVEQLGASLQTAQRPWISLVRAGRPAPMEPPLTDADGSLRWPQAVSLYSQGYTLVLGHLHRRWPSLTSLCEELRQAIEQVGGLRLKGVIGANVYCTPADSQGLAPHADVHDVLVLQVEGRKEWRVERLCEPAGAAMDANTSDGPPASLQYQLGPGDVLYLPRGAIHEASTSDVHSVHVTISIPRWTWVELVVSLVRQHQAADEPVSSRDADADEMLRKLRVIFEEVANEATLEQAMLQHDLKQLGTVRPPQYGGLVQLNSKPSMSASTMIRRRPGASGIVVAAGDVVTLHFTGGSTRVALAWQGALNHILGSESCRIEDLPGPYGVRDKVSLAKRLVLEGFLETVDE